MGVLTDSVSIRSFGLRLCRWGAYFFLCLFLLVVLTVGGGLLWLRTSHADQLLRTEGMRLLNAVLVDSGITCEAASLSGPLPNALAVRGLVLKDVHGPWFTVDEAAILPDIGALLHGQIRIREIRVMQPVLLRVPDLPPSPKAPSADPLAFTRDLPSWLPYIRIDAMVVRGFSVSAELVSGNVASGEGASRLTFDADGTLAVPTYAEIGTSLHVRRTDVSDPQATTDLRLEATLFTVKQFLRLRLDAADGSENTPGLLHALVPELRGLSLSLAGEDPIERWSGDLTLNAFGLGQVSGYLGVWFGLNREPGARSLSFSLFAEPDAALPAPWPVALAGTWLQGVVELHAGSVRVPLLRLDVEGLAASLDMHDFSMTEPDAGSSGNLRLGGRADVSLKAPQALGAFAPPVTEATAKLVLGGSLFTPTVDLDVHLTQLQAGGAAPADWNVALQTSLDTAGQGLLDVAATSALAKLSLALKAHGKLPQDFARDGHLPETVSMANLPQLLRDLALSAALTLDVPKPAQLVPVLAGSPDLHLTLNAALGADGINVNTALPAVQVSGQALDDIRLELVMPVPETLSAAQTSLPLRVTGSVRTPQGPATLHLDGKASANAVEITAITARLAGLGLTGALSALLDTSPPALDGSLRLRVDDWAALAPLLPLPITAQNAQLDLRLTPDAHQSAELVLQASDLRSPDTAELTLPALSVRVRGRELFTTPVVEAEIKADAGSATGVVWQTLESRLNARFVSAGDRPSLDMSVEATGIAPGALTGAAPVSLSFTARMAPSAAALVCALKADGLGIEPFSGDLTIPLKLLDGIPTPDMDAAVVGALAWKGQLAPVWSLIPVANCRVRGEGLVDLRLGGTLRNPRPGGVVQLENVLFQELALALELSHMKGEVRFDADGTARVSIAGDGGRGGSFAFGGNIGPMQAGFPLQLSGTFTNMAPLLRRDLRFALNGDIAVQGTPVAPDVSANLVVNSGELRVENLPGGGVTTLEVEQGNAEPPPPPAALGNLNVSLSVPGRFYVRGHGIESEWKGQLGITGPINNPAVVGQIASVRGTFTFLGKLFTLVKGQVNFDGGTPPKPMLDIQLAFARQDFTALIEVLGPATSPRLNLTSQPRQPKDEIISQILFGSPTGGLGRAEALELATTLASMTLFGSKGGSFLDVTRETFGLDVLRVGAPRGIGNAATRSVSRLFTPFGNTGLGSAGAAGQQNSTANESSAENMSVEIGKYVMDQVYVGVEQGMDDKSTGVVVTIEVSPHLNLEARSNGKGTEVGASWFWDY